MSKIRALALELAPFTKLSRDANLIVLAAGLSSLPFGYLMVIQSIYLKMIGIDEGSIGLILSVSTLTSSLLIIPFGILSDRYSRKWIMIFGQALTAFAWLIYAGLAEVWGFYASSLLLGIGTAGIFGPYQALLAEKTTDEDRTVAFSLSAFAYMAGSTVGAMASGVPEWLIREIGSGIFQAYRPLFLAAFLISSLASLILIPLRESPPIRRGGKILPTKSRKEIGKLSAVTMLVGLGAGLIISLIPLWLHLRFGVGGAELGPLFVVANAVMAASYLVSPTLSRRIGPVRAIVSTQMLSTAFLVIMPVMPAYNIVAVLYVIRTFLMNMSGPIQSAFIMSLISPEERASASAICSPQSGVVWGVSYSVSQGIGGFMLEQGMLALPFYICGLLYLLASIFFLVFFRESKV